MAHPPYGDDPDNSGKFNENDGLPRYPETNHPEDQPGFGQNRHGSDSAAQEGSRGSHAGYQSTPGVGYQGEGYAGSGGYGLGTEEAPTRPGDGKVGVFDSIGWGFKATFANPTLWILGALLFYLVAVVLSLLPLFLGFGMGAIDPEKPDVAGSMNLPITLISAIFSLVVSLITYRLVLKQIDSPNPGWGDIGRDVRWGRTLLVSILTSVVVGLIMLLLYILFAATILTDFADTMAGISAEEPSGGEILKAFFKLLGGLGLIVLIGLLLNPLYMLMVWFASDGKSFDQSLSQGFRAGIRNFLPLLGLNILLSIILGFTALIPFVPIITFPAYMLALGHAYRQAAGGPVPVEGRRG